MVVPEKRNKRRVVAKLMRRTHLFLALFLAPWIAMYALSTIVMHHRALLTGAERRIDPSYQTIRQSEPYIVDAAQVNSQELARRILIDYLYNLSSPNWSVVGTWPASVQVPAAGDVPRQVGAELLKTAGLQTRVFSVGRAGTQQVAVYIADMWQTRRLILDLKSQELTLYEHGFDARIFLAGLHSRSGYRHASLASDLWAVMVDLVSFGILVWIATGLYIWWNQRRMRKIGLVALILGAATFLVFMFTL